MVRHRWKTACSFRERCGCVSLRAHVSFVLSHGEDCWKENSGHKPQKPPRQWKSEAAVVYLRERLLFFVLFFPSFFFFLSMCFVHSKQVCAFSQPASELPLLIGRCRFVPPSSASFSLGSSCDLLCLNSTILTLSFSLNPTNNDGDTCWSHLAPGLCESITKGGDGHLSIAALLPPPADDILSSVTQLARSSGSHPKTGIMLVYVGASHASCQPFVGGSVCLEWLPLGACGSTIAGILSATPIYAQHVNRSKELSGCTGFVSRLPRSTCFGNSVTLWEIESSLFIIFLLFTVFLMSSQ